MPNYSSVYTNEKETKTKQNKTTSKKGTYKVTCLLKVMFEWSH